MSNLQRQIRKNQENYFIQQMYKNMTPEQYQEGIRTAIQKTKTDLIASFKKDYEKLEAQYNRNLQQNMTTVINTISVELLYELANQMNYWDLKDDNEDDEYKKESAKYRIKEMFDNTMNAIRKYASMKSDNQASKIFEKKKKKVEKEFDISF